MNIFAKILVFLFGVSLLVSNYNPYLTEIVETIKETSTHLTIKLGYNLLYWFSVCQIEFQKVTNKMNPSIILLWKDVLKYLTDNGILLNPNKCKILVLLDNNGNEISKTTLTNSESWLTTECKDINLTDSSCSGLILMDTNVDTGCVNNVFYETIPTSFDYKVASINFMMLELEHQNVKHLIELKNKQHNYYIVNNSLNKNFFKYYLKNVLNVNINETNFDYTLTIVDHNINMITLLPHQYLVINEHDYQIYPPQNNSSTSNSDNETQTSENDSSIDTSTDSDKSDDFVKLESTQ
jgi:hypothetical protein